MNKLNYQQLHKWVHENKGIPQKCENCGKLKDEIQIGWANISYEYKEDINDWMALCASCNIKRDRKNGWGKAKLIFPEKVRVKNIPDYPTLYTRKHIAILFGISSRTLHRYEKIGMPVVHIGPGKLPRYDYEDVLVWMQKMEKTGGD